MDAMELRAHILLFLFSLSVSVYSETLLWLMFKTVTRAGKRRGSVMNWEKAVLAVNCKPGVVYALGWTDCLRVDIGEMMITAPQWVKEHFDHPTKGNCEMSATARHFIESRHQIHALAWKARGMENAWNKTYWEGKCTKHWWFTRWEKGNSKHLMKRKAWNLVISCFYRPWHLHFLLNDCKNFSRSVCIIQAWTNLYTQT